MSVISTIREDGMEKAMSRSGCVLLALLLIYFRIEESSRELYALRIHD